VNLFAELITLLFKLAIGMCGLALMIFVGVIVADFAEKSNLPNWMCAVLGGLTCWLLFYLSDKLLLPKSTKNNNK
jgi:hypothetical protein